MAAPIYQLKVALQDIKPSIWRRIEVPSDTTLYLLHRTIQGAMGWTNSHLNQFTTSDRKYYGIPSDDDFHDVADERNVKIDAVLQQEKDTVYYEYDFGDGWQHKITLEKIIEPQAGLAYPRLTDGKNACPPEDCGGPWGYMNLIEVLKKPKHPEHESMLGWIGFESGDKWKPEAFDLEARQKEMMKSYNFGIKNKGKEFNF